MILCQTKYYEHHCLAATEGLLSYICWFAVSHYIAVSVQAGITHLGLAHHFAAVTI